jgi:predicted ATPase/transcriptional regulator with XRE-family HTH domain
MDGEPTFGAWLKSRRRQLDLTQKGLAHLVGCSVGTIRKMEVDERRPSRQLAGLLAQHLDIPSDQHETFIAFARSEPYIAKTPHPVLPADEDQIPIIPHETKETRIKHNLPLETTKFVGREKDLATLGYLFTNHERRLVTILGPGGIGKTRLALAYAAQQLDEKDEPVPHHYEDGVYFVDLTPLSDADGLVLHLAEALNLSIRIGTREKRSSMQQLLDRLRDRRLLLVLDNFDHLLFPLHSPNGQEDKDSTTLIGEVLRNSPYMRILVTSRERLNLQVEQVFAIEGLTYPELETQAFELSNEDFVGYTAIQFFFQAAHRSRQDFSLNTDDERQSLVQICQLVSGMPLGLELAAAWVDVLPLSDISAEIQQCLDFLETELRDVPSRHRNMRATIDSSWQKLDQKEQNAFTKLSIFRGGFTREAAQLVTGATLRQLSRLVNKSFIQFNQKQNRYQVLELLRQYGADRLSQADNLEEGLLDQHSNFYCQLLANYSDDLKGAGQLQALAAIGNDIENVRLAWNHAILRQDLEPIGLSLESMHRFYWNEGWLIQGIREFERAVSGLRTDNPVGKRGFVLGGLLAFLGRFYWYTGQKSRALETLHESLDLLQRLGARERKLMPLLFLAEMQETLEESASMYQECLALAREVGDQWAIGHALLLLGMNSVRAGDYQRAEGRWQEALKQFNQNRDPGGISFTLGWLSMLAVDLGRYQEALSLAQESISVTGEDDPIAVCWLAQALCATGMYAEGQELLQQILVLMRERDDKSVISQGLFYLGEISFQMGDYDRAEEALQESLALALVSDPWGFAVRNHDALGRVDLARGEFLHVRVHLQDALKTTIPLGEPPLLLKIFATVAELFAKEGDLAFAALLATFVTSHPASQAKVKERVEHLLARLEEQLTVEEMAEIRQRSQECDLDSLAAQLLIDLELS